MEAEMNLIEESDVSRNLIRVKTLPVPTHGCKGNPLPPRLSISNSASASNASSAFRCIFHLPMHLPPSNVSSASRCVFRFATRLTPPDLSPAPASCGMSRLLRHISSPAVQLVSRSSRFGSSPLPTSRGITRHHATSCNIMQHTMTFRNSRGTTHLPLAFRSWPGCPATSQDIPRLPLPLLPSHPWDIPGSRSESRSPLWDPRHHYVFQSVALSSNQPSVGSNESRNASRTTARIPHSTPDLHPLPPCSCSSPAVALLRFASCSFSPFGFLFISFYVLYLIRVTLYIRPCLQVDPYPFLFGSPARYALLFSPSLHNKLNPSDPLLVPRSAPPPTPRLAQLQ